MTSTSTASAAQWVRNAPKNPSPERTAEWLYNEIMRFLNPDLMTDHLPLLEAKYVGESDLEKAARRASYEESFKTYDVLVKDVTAPLVEAGHAALRRLQASRAQDEQAEANAVLQSLDDTFSSVA